MKIREAVEITAGLSFTAKMPCPSYNLPAYACKTGSKLRKKEGTVCSKCYGHKGRYTFKNVKDAQEKRLRSIRDPRWVEAMTVLIEKSGTKYFRWFDSGDIQSIEHLRKIINIARRLPDVQFWLPTKETKLLSVAHRRGLRTPKNLVVRHSVPYLYSTPQGHLKRLLTASVGSGEGFICPVKSGTESCDDYECRACFSKEVKNVDYHKH